VTCPPNTYERDNFCHDVVGNAIAINSQVFFTANTLMDYPLSNALPNGFTSSCTGPCSNQWSIRDSFVSTGFNYGHVISKLTYAFKPWPNHKPTISFTASVIPISPSDRAFAGLEFFINGQLMPMKYGIIKQDFKFTVPSTVTPNKMGRYILNWVFSQYPKAGDPPAVEARISDLMIEGTASGVVISEFKCRPGSIIAPLTPNITVCQPCSAGYYHKTTDNDSSCVRCPRNAVSLPGSTECHACGLGTTPSGPDNCDTKNCQFTATISGKPRTFDLKPLPLASAWTDFPHDEIDISLCSRQINPKIKPTYLLYKTANATQFYSLGDLLEFKAPKKKEQDKPWTFEIIFNRTQNPPPECDLVETTIVFKCQLRYNETHVPRITKSLRVTQKGRCKVDFRWDSAHACPLCRVDDFELIDSECINNTRQHAYRPLTECFGDAPRPAWTTDCSAEFQITLARSTVGWFFLACIIVAGLFFVVYIIVYARKKYIGAQYETLTGRDIDEDDDDEQDEENASKL